VTSLIKRHGGRVTAAVSGKTSYLLVRFTARDGERVLT
jgi:BRCT domain type II-containing protein